MAEPVIEITDLCKYFPLRTGIGRGSVLKAVDHVSFSVEEGEVLVLMGESGCGKTTCALTAIRLLDPSGGIARFRGDDLFSMRGAALRSARREVQIVLQNPLASLDPRVTARRAISEPLYIHKRFLRVTNAEIDRRVLSLAETVGLREEELGRYPRDLSGGQQQRVCVCRALVLSPRLLVMDEPTSALDVSVQARVLNLLLDLKEQYSLTYLFVTHNAAVAHYVGERVAIMYLGQIVEMGRAEDVLRSPLHPYSKGLMQSVLSANSSISSVELKLEGTPERAVDLPPGCVFQRRCSQRKLGDPCQEPPDLLQVEPGQFVRCHLYADRGADPTWLASNRPAGTGPNAGGWGS